MIFPIVLPVVLTAHALFAGSAGVAPAAAAGALVPPGTAFYSILPFSILPATTLADEGVPPAGFERDADYARKLASLGYKRHADELIKRLKSSAGITDAQKAELSFVEATNLIEVFAKERDFEESRKIYDLAKKAIAEYIKIAKPGPSLTEANYHNGDLDRRFGEKVAEQIKREPPGERVNTLIAEGEKAFQSAIGYFSDRKSQMKEKAESESKTAQDEKEYQVAAYAVPNTYLSYAYLYPSGNSKRESNLRQAAAKFEDYCTEAPEGTMAFYDGTVKWGASLRDLAVELGADATRAKEKKVAEEIEGLYAQAADCFAQALQLLYWRDDENNEIAFKPGDPELDERARFLIVEALTEASRMWMKQKGSLGFIIKRYEDARGAMPTFEQESPKGFDLVYLAARAYEETGNKAKASSEAKRIVKNAPPDLLVVQDAKELLTKLGETAEDSENVTMIQVVGAIEAQLRQGNFPDAVRAFQRSRERWRGTVAEKKYWPELLLRGALAYQQCGRPLEAYLLFYEIGDRYPQSKDAPKALAAAVYEACKVWKTLKGEWAGQLVSEAVDKLQSQFPEAPEAQEAQQANLQTQQLVGGKSQVELARIGEEQLKSLSKTEPKYGRITFETAQRYYRGGASALSDKKKSNDVVEARAGAERCFDMYVEWAGAQQTLDPVEKAKIDERTITSLISKAQMWLWEPGSAVEKTLSILSQVEERASKSASARARAFETEQIKARAFIRQNRLDQAVSIADAMFSKDPSNARTAATLKRVADVTWDAIRAEKDPAKKDKLIDQGMKFYRNWIAAGEKGQSAISAVDYNSVGAKMFQLGLFKNGVEAWPGSYFRVDLAKFPYQEAARESADLFARAVTANEQSPQGGFDAQLARYRRGQVLGLLQQWRDLVAEYKTLMTEESMDDGRELKAIPGRAYKTEQVANDLAWAFAQLSAQGDKEAGKEAIRLASLALIATTPKGSAKPTFDFWFARYISVFAMVRNGDLKLAGDTMLEYYRSDKDLDNNEFGFKTRFETLVPKK